MQPRRIRIALAASLLLLFGTGISTAQVAPGPQKSRVVARAVNGGGLQAGPATSLTPVSAAPGTISFTATDPDLGSVAGSSASTVSWTTTGGSAATTWNLKVHAATASFTNCATVPTSAITVTCTSVTGGTAGACKPAITLSTASQQVATGKESASASAPYSVSMNFTLADSWAYIAKTSPACTQTLTYTVTAP